MTNTLVQKLAYQLFNKYNYHRKNFHIKITPVNDLAYKLDRFCSSPDHSIKLPSLFSFFGILLVNRTVKIVQETCCWFTQANLLDNEKLGNETCTRVKKLVVENCHRKLVA